MSCTPYRRRACVSLVVLLALAAPALAQNWATFVNQTSTRLILEPNVPANDPEEKSFAVGDVDLDGDLDLLMVRKIPFTEAGGRRDVLFMNEGTAEGHPLNGVLVDRTSTLAPRLLDATNDRDAILVDVNGDGWLDIVTAVTLGEGLPKDLSHPRIYINRKDDLNGNWLGFAFDDVNRVPTFPQTPAFASVSAGDIDGDGDLDLYFTDYTPAYGGSLQDRLLINNGNGYFADESALRMTAEMRQSAFGTSGHISDVNGDGKKDIVKDTALFAPQRVSVSYNAANNQGFMDRFDIVYTNAPYFVQVGDLNNDNKVDMWISDDGSDRYMINTGNDAQGMANFNTIVFSGQDDGFGGNSYAEDLNNDGFRDVLITDVDIDIPGCSRRTHIYRNLGNVPNVTLAEQGTLGIGEANLTGTHDAAIFDINGDGWKDIVLGRCNGTFVWVNQPPVGLVFTYPDGLPSQLTPNQAHTFRVAVAAFGGTQPIAGTGKIYISLNEGPFVATPMTHLGGNVYQTSLPGVPCPESVRFYVSADATVGGTFYDPSNAPAAYYTAVAANGVTITRDEIEGDVSGWLISNDPGLTSGDWEAAVPNGTIIPGGYAAPPEDATAGIGVRCFVTENGPAGGAAGANDLDGGPTRLTSPQIDLSSTDAVISYARWFYCDDEGFSGQDTLITEISNNGGFSWVLVHSTTGTANEWQTVSFQVSDYVAPTNNVRVRFTTNDTPNNSVTEAGIDNFEVRAFDCSGAPCPGDIDGDGSIGQTDLGILLSAFGHCEGDPEYDPAADLDGDNCVGQTDLGVVLGVFGQDCP